MERRDYSSVASFFLEEEPAAGDPVALTGDALQHALVRRLREADPVRLINGRGRVATGRVARADKRSVVVRVDAVEAIARPGQLEVLVPVADRDRMLWAAEKCAELQVTDWRPVQYARSRSVTGRGEGAKFAAKVRARMMSALEQCGGAWLPAIHEDADLAAATRAAAGIATRIVLDPDGAPIAGMVRDGAVALAVGPAGGIDPGEFRALVGSGWAAASLGPSILRFETAVTTAVGVVRALQPSPGSV